MDTLKEYIKNKRPNLSKQSVNTYASILKNLYIRVFGDDNIDINNYNKSTDILNNLKTIPPNKRKTVLSALVIVTDNNDYRNQMLKDIESYTEDQHKQVKNDKQEDSWVDGDEIKTVYDKLAKEAKLLYRKDIILKSQGDQLSMSDLQDIQNYVILSLLGGIYIPPRRSKDYVDFKIHDIDKGHDNYMVKDHFIFNSYKTAKTYGRQMVAIPKELKTIMTKWIKINPTNYLLFDSNKNRLSNVKLNQRLNKLFDHKKVGVNQLRHTYLSDKYQDSIETNNSMANDLTNMGSSSSQEKVYIKKHKPKSKSDILDV
jgi:hypothetical protein